MLDSRTNDQKANTISGLNNKISNNDALRIVKLAMTVSPDFSRFIVNAYSENTNLSDHEKKELVLAFLSITMAKINAVTERDLSLRFVLIADNDALFFLIIMSLILMCLC